MKISHQNGFSLIEVVISLVVASLIYTMADIPVSHFLEVQKKMGYQEQLRSRHQEWIQRFEREIGQAYPDSVRVTQFGPVLALEWVPVKIWGRYRQKGSALTSLPFCPLQEGQSHPEDGDGLSLNLDNCFKTLGNMSVTVEENDQVALPDGGPGPFYEGLTRARLKNVLQGSGESMIQMDDHSFPQYSVSNLFAIVSSPKSWVCDPVKKTLSLYEKYTIDKTQRPLLEEQPIYVYHGVEQCSISLNGLWVSLSVSLQEKNVTTTASASALESTP